MNTRKQGDLLENLIYNELDVVKTKGSGSVKHDGDLKDDNFVIECKRRNQKNLNIDKKWIDIVKKQAELCNKNWVIINQLNDDKIYATIDYETFKVLYRKVKAYEELLKS